MSSERFLPEIETVFDSETNNPNSVLYRDVIHRMLKKILPDYLSFDFHTDPEAVHSLLPYVTHTESTTFPGDMSFFALSKYRQNSFKFFFDMVSRWLVPGKRLNVVLIYAADFKMPKFSTEVYTICEVIIRIEKQHEYEQITRNLPFIEKELHLGISSRYYARRILEIKGLTSDEKTAFIQETIASLISRLPNIFNHDLLTEMQHILVMCKDEFKAARDSSHLARIIATQYFFRNVLCNAVAETPQNRHIKLKLFRARVCDKGVIKSVLGILIGINFFQDKEVMEKTHILKAIQTYLGDFHYVEDSFFSNRRGSENISMLYLEIEKMDKSDFSGKEIHLLRKELPNELRDRIEHLMPPVFMPSNEEEIIRNILSLSSQIKYLRDIPQVFISFHEQSHDYLFFTIIAVRILKPNSVSIQEQFKSSGTFLEYIHDRCQNAGSLRQKYKKEATVFRVKILKEQFLRADYSIDLNKARQVVVNELARILGDIRDYNGGMISKQNELLSEVHNLFIHNDIKYNHLLLENFFYSLTPVIMRTVLEPGALKTLFLMMVGLIENQKPLNIPSSLEISFDVHYAYAVIKTSDSNLKDDLNRALSILKLHSSELGHSQLIFYGTSYLGYIYRCEDTNKKQLFCQTIKHILSEDLLYTQTT